MTYLPHQIRVIDEKTDLDHKLVKLTQFMVGGDFMNLPLDEQLRLRRQLLTMHHYSEILGDRIAAFLSPSK